MKSNNKPPIFNTLSDIIDMFFDDDGCCRITNKIPYFVVLFLSWLAPEDYKIIICSSEDNLPDDDSYLIDNGHIKEKIDGLSNIYRKKHILKTPGKRDKYFTTSLNNYRKKNGTYSYFLINLCMDLASIEYMSYEKMAEVIKLFYRNQINTTKSILHN